MPIFSKSFKEKFGAGKKEGLEQGVEQGLEQGIEKAQSPPTFCYYPTLTGSLGQKPLSYRHPCKKRTFREPARDLLSITTNIERACSWHYLLLLTYYILNYHF